MKIHDRRPWLAFDLMKYDGEWITFGDQLCSEERVLAIQEMGDTSSGEKMPHEISEVRGKPVDINIFIDTEHTGYKITRWSHIWLIIFPIIAHIS